MAFNREDSFLLWGMMEQFASGEPFIWQRLWEAGLEGLGRAEHTQLRRHLFAACPLGAFPARGMRRRENHQQTDHLETEHTQRTHCERSRLTSYSWGPEPEKEHDQLVRGTFCGTLFSKPVLSFVTKGKEKVICRTIRAKSYSRALEHCSFMEDGPGKYFQLLF